MSSELGSGPQDLLEMLLSVNLVEEELPCVMGDVQILVQFDNEMSH